jgi:hypothetical protein
MMPRARMIADDYRSLALLLLLVGAVSATAIMSCGGGGGGGADGGLCSQCGVSPDGPCQPEVFVAPGPDADALCSEATRATGCTVTLSCLRKVDSAQRRCFPFDANQQFKCDGSRAGGTAVPEPTITPTGTPGPSGTVTVTATPTPGPNCGNGDVDTGEQCDGINLDDNTCEDLCNQGAGALACTTACTFDFSGCEQPGTCSP